MSPEPTRNPQYILADATPQLQKLQTELREVRRAYEMMAHAIGYVHYPEPRPPRNLAWRDVIDILADLDDHPEDYDPCENCGCPISKEEHFCLFCGSKVDEE